MHFSPALALGVSAAGCWGLSGFVGGLAARRMGALIVAAATQLAGFLVVIAALAVTQPHLPDLTSLLPPLAGGLAGGLGLVALFRALSLGQMGLLAPIAGTGVAIPIIVGVATGELPSPYQGAGVLAALGGVLAATWRGDQVAIGESRPGDARGLPLAILAAGLFGLFYLGLAASAEQNVLWTVAAARLLSVALLVALAGVAWRARPRPLGGVTGRMAASGTLDVTGNAVFAAATTKGPLVQAAVPAALYPLVTLLLARALLGERLQRGQRAGAALALTGLALMAVPT